MGELDGMATDLISVIVPVYNVEKYLRHCIESIQRQTYTNLEIILVNDGSTDNSPLICDAYAQVDTRIKVIHKPNGGLSETRNLGIDAATGKYMLLVDSDDYIGEKCVQILYDTVRQTGAQIAICDFVCVNEDENREFAEGDNQISLFDRVECLKQVYLSKIHGLTFMPVAKLCELSLFRDNHIRYPIGKIHEDMFVTYKVLYYADQIAYVNSIQYFYLQRGGSIMHREFGAKSLAGVEAQKSACDFFREKGERELYLCAYNAYLKACCQTLDKIQRVENRELSREWSRIIMEKFRSSLNYRDLTALGLVRAVFYTLVGIRPWKCLLKYTT